MKRRSILVIDDDQADAELCETALGRVRGSPYAVSRAASAEGGLAAVRSGGVDCVLLDYGLPGADGVSVLKRIRAHDPFLPVVMLSGHGASEIAVQAIQAGAQNYIAKSMIGPDVLHEAITAAIAECSVRRSGPHSAPSVAIVLIIDDSEEDREALVRALDQVHGTGLRCLEAADGMQGIAMIGDHRPDCALLDYSLPGRNGLEILKLIRSVDRFLPVIMLTGQGNEAVAVRAMKAGAQNYLVKSNVTPETLYHAVEVAIQRATLERTVAEQQDRILAQQQELTQTNRLNSTILGGAAYMIVATDIDGIILAFNRAAEAALGYGAAEVIGQCTPMLWHDRGEVARRAAQLSAELGVRVEPDFAALVSTAGGTAIAASEWTLVRRDGRRFPARLSVAPLQDDEGRAVGFVAMMEDITASREMDRLKNEFVSVVSHELRTPLTSIRGSLGLIGATMATELPDKAARLVDVAYRNCERLIALVNDILDIDKIGAGKMRFDIRREDLSALLQQAADANRGIAEKLGVSIALAPVPGDWTVAVDAARLTQILSNLLSNAIKFSTAGQTVELSAEALDQWVRIKVSDRGPGIPPEARHRIFGRFSQVDSSIARQTGGSGLGLHISKELIERMGGRIGFESEVGRGTTFWVDVRPAEAVHGSPPTAPRERASGGSRRVLVCEDDGDIGELIRTILNGAGFDVDVARTLADARRLIRTGRYDAVTLDVTFPFGDGIDLARELDRDPEIERPPCIVVSGTARSTRLPDPADVGLADWLVKPFDPGHLVRAVFRAIAGNGGMESKRASI
jgi:PAS domain S-box-containing protein